MDAKKEVSAIGPNAQPAKVEISPEHFVPDHVFVYVTKGELRAHDGNKSYTLQADDYCLVRKNQLVRYDRENPEFERVVICFEESFLKTFQENHNIQPSYFNPDDTFVSIPKNKIIPDFTCSLKPYLDNSGRINEAFATVKYEELLIILLQIQPELAGIFFTYDIPGKVNLEEFMNKNYIFNVSVQHFAFLTGRSLSAFKRDFQKIFHKTPNRWLVQKRLQEAYFLIEKKNRKPTDIYLDLGFENLSHFSFAFRKLFGRTPTTLAENVHSNQ
ncbi:AraC family transcriptional regulator [Hymenobacter psoromatis]|nr:AraC family transcriptional regulator [Hymenobacter psoromatis]